MENKKLKKAYLEAREIPNTTSVCNELKDVTLKQNKRVRVFVKGNIIYNPLLTKLIKIANDNDLAYFILYDTEDGFEFRMHYL